MALAKAKRTIKRLSGPRYVGVTAGVTCYQGGLAILASGYARPGRQGQGADNAAKAVDAATYRAVGIFLETVTGGVANGDVSVNVEEGPFLFKTRQQATRSPPPISASAVTSSTMRRSPRPIPTARGPSLAS